MTKKALAHIYDHQLVSAVTKGILCLWADKDIEIHTGRIKFSSEWLAHVPGCPQATSSLGLE